MARIKGPNFLKWRSKHGGTVGYSFRTVAAMRQHSSPRPKISAPSTAYADALRKTLSLWHDFPLEDKNVWNAFSSLYPGIDKYGNSIYWSGFNWFVRLCGVRMWLVGSPVLVPPPSPSPSFTPSYSLFGGVGPLSILFVPDPLPASEQFVNVSRSLNLGEAVTSGPNFLKKFKLYGHGECNPGTLAFTPEFQQGGFNHFFGLQAYDEYGRSAGKERFLFTT